jgi:hypothetical protein
VVLVTSLSARLRGRLADDAVTSEQPTRLAAAAVSAASRSAVRSAASAEAGPTAPATVSTSRKRRTSAAEHALQRLRTWLTSGVAGMSD